MSVFAKGQTSTAVHSTDAAMAQRQGEAIRDHFTLSAVHLYAQLVIGMALVLYRHVSTPGYMSLALLIVPLVLLYAVSCRLSQREGIMERPLGKAADVLLFLCLFSDAQMSLYAFTEIVREMLPDYNSAVIALVTLLCVLPSLKKQNAHALPTLGRLLKIPLIVGIGFCMLTAARRGSMSHLFPLFGMGERRVFTGAFWMCSALSAALTPLYIKTPPLTMQQKKRGFFALLSSLLFGCVTAFWAAYMLPFYFLARPDTMGAQLLLPLKVYPTLSSWSVMVCLMMLLLLVSLASALSRGRHILSHVIQKPISIWAAFLLVPLPALSTDIALQIVAHWAPVRIFCMAAALLLLALAGKGRKEGKTA